MINPKITIMKETFNAEEVLGKTLERIII